VGVCQYLSVGGGIFAVLLFFYHLLLLQLLGEKKRKKQQQTLWLFKKSWIKATKQTTNATVEHKLPVIKLRPLN